MPLASIHALLSLLVSIIFVALEHCQSSLFFSGVCRVWCAALFEHATSITVGTGPTLMVSPTLLAPMRSVQLCQNPLIRCPAIQRDPWIACSNGQAACVRSVVMTQEVTSSALISSRTFLVTRCKIALLNVWTISMARRFSGNLCGLPSSSNPVQGPLSYSDAVGR